MALGMSKARSPKAEAARKLREWFPLRMFLSMRHRQDRRAELLPLLAAAGLGDAEWFPAVELEALRGDARHFSSLGKRSCALGKRLVLREAGRRKVPAVLFLEDDLVFHPEFAERIANLELPDDWGIFHIGCLHLEPPEYHSPGLVRVRRAVDNHAIAIRAEWFLKVRATLRGWGVWDGKKLHSDVLLSTLNKIIPSYAAYPNLTWQAENWSDLQQSKYSNYHPDGRQRWNSEVLAGFHMPPSPMPTRRTENRAKPVKKDAGRSFIHLVPYSLNQSIATAYNEAIARVTGFEWILLTDADVMFLTPDYGHLIAQVIRENPGAGLITCYTSRVGPTRQLTASGLMSEPSLLKLREVALEHRRKFGAAVSPIAPPVSGMFLLFRKKTWKAVGGFKGEGMLGVDWQFSKAVHAAGLPILRMDGLFVAHFYRLDSGTGNLGHLRARKGKPPPRTGLINRMIAHQGYRSYLEIGLGKGEHFNGVQCADKESVDPGDGTRAVAATHRMTSDEFFARNRRRYDLIFIDGLHHCETVFRDICNALAALSPGGMVVCHDLNPATEEMQAVPRRAREWTGDCWKAWVRLRRERPTLPAVVADTDYGVGVIFPDGKPGGAERLPEDAELTWENLERNRRAWLNLVPAEEVERALFTRDGDSSGKEVNCLTYCDFTPSAGISHQKSNLTAMLKEAAICGRDLLVPKFRLAGSHNHGRTVVTQMAEYFDFSKVTVEGKPVGILLSVPASFSDTAVCVRSNEPLNGRAEGMIAKEMKGVGLVRLPLESTYAGFSKMSVEIPTHPSLVRMAEAMAARIPANAAWVHVRRGDRLNQTAAATTPENIRRVLQKTAPDTRAVYVATNETDGCFFAPLAEHYRLFRMEDFEPFKALGMEDNYKLFLVEQAFGALFPVRISTFKTGGNHFHGSLCELPGWQ